MVDNVIVNAGEGISGTDIDPDYLKGVIKKNLKKQFREIIGGEPKSISEKQVHEIAKVGASGDMTIFYRYLFTKYVSNKLKQDAESGMLNNHASIFPFQVKPELIDGMPELDNKFSAEIEEFVEKHFGNDCDFDVLKNSLWANIKDFKENNFPNPPSLIELTRHIEVGSGPPNWRDRKPLSNCDYLKNFIRLNVGGARWYLNFQTKFNEACTAYEKECLILPIKNKSYFKYLPEINCCELLLLLETDFYRKDEVKYTHLFKKYLFFFKNAIDRKDHPVCFIDETLFACLQFKREYEIFREGKSIYDYVWELCMMTLVHRRKHRIFSNQAINLIVRPDQSDLEKVVTYADELLKGVESVSVYYGEPQYQRFKVFLLLDDTVFLINYSSRKGASSGDRFGQILKSALLSPDIKKLKYYNAYLGIEKIYEMPQQKEEICSFIQQQTEIERNANRLEPRYTMKFLIPMEVRIYFAKLPPIPR